MWRKQLKKRNCLGPGHEKQYIICLGRTDYYLIPWARNFMFTLRNYSQLCKATTDILCGARGLREGGIKIKRWQRPITHFHNISGHKSCNACVGVTHDAWHLVRVSRAVVTFVTLCGDQEQRRQDKDVLLHCEARVRTQSQGDRGSYISNVCCFSVSWWSTFSTHWAGNGVMTPNFDDKEVTQDNKPRQLSPCITCFGAY